MKKKRFYCGVATLCLIAGCSSAIPQLFAQAEEGIELLHSHYYAEAEGKLQAALDADQENNSVRYYLGMALLNQGKYAEALKKLEAAGSEQERASQWSPPTIPSVYQVDLALAQAYLGLQRYEDAWPKLQSARIENPDSSDVFLYRGVYYYMQKEYESAVEDLEKAIKLDSQNSYAYYYVGMAYFEMSQLGEMVEVFKIFLQIAPNAPEAPDVKRMVNEMC